MADEIIRVALGLSSNMDLSADDRLQDERYHQSIIRELYVLTDHPNTLESEKKLGIIIRLWDTLMKHPSKTKYVEETFIMLLRKTSLTVLTPRWETISSQLKQELFTHVRMCGETLKYVVEQSYEKCLHVVELGKDPWTIRYIEWESMLAGQIEFNDSQVQIYFNIESPEIVLSRIHFLVVIGCEEHAAHLSKHAVSFYAGTCSSKRKKAKEKAGNKLNLGALVPAVAWFVDFLRRKKTLPEISKMIDGLSCHMALYIIKFVKAKQLEEFYNFLVELFVINEILESKPCFCTKELLRLWCMCLKAKKLNLLQVTEVVKKSFAKYSPTSAHFYILIDALWEQFGDTFLTLYVELFIRALTTDINHLDVARCFGSKRKVAKLEAHLAKMYFKLSLLFNNTDGIVARECVLSSFSLKPNKERHLILQSLTHGILSEQSHQGTEEMESDSPSSQSQDAVWTKIQHPFLKGGIENVPYSLVSDLVIVLESVRCNAFQFHSFDWSNVTELSDYLRMFTHRNSLSNKLTVAPLSSESEHDDGEMENRGSSHPANHVSLKKEIMDSKFQNQSVRNVCSDRQYESLNTTTIVTKSEVNSKPNAIVHNHMSNKIHDNVDHSQAQKSMYKCVSNLTTQMSSNTDSNLAIRKNSANHHVVKNVPSKHVPSNFITCSTVSVPSVSKEYLEQLNRNTDPMKLDGQQNDMRLSQKRYIENTTVEDPLDTGKRCKLSADTSRKIPATVQSQQPPLEGLGSLEHFRNMVDNKSSINLLQERLQGANTNSSMTNRPVPGSSRPSLFHPKSQRNMYSLPANSNNTLTDMPCNVKSAVIPRPRTPAVTQSSVGTDPLVPSLPRPASTGTSLGYRMPILSHSQPQRKPETFDRGSVIQHTMDAHNINPHQLPRVPVTLSQAVNPLQQLSKLPNNKSYAIKVCSANLFYPKNDCSIAGDTVIQDGEERVRIPGHLLSVVLSKSDNPKSHESALSGSPSWPTEFGKQGSIEYKKTKSNTTVQIRPVKTGRVYSNPQSPLPLVERRNSLPSETKHAVKPEEMVDNFQLPHPQEHQQQPSFDNWNLMPIQPEPRISSAAESQNLHKNISPTNGTDSRTMPKSRLERCLAPEQPNVINYRSLMESQNPVDLSLAVRPRSPQQLICSIASPPSLYAMPSSPMESYSNSLPRVSSPRVYGSTSSPLTVIHNSPPGVQRIVSPSSNRNTFSKSFALLQDAVPQPQSPTNHHMFNCSVDSSGSFRSPLLNSSRVCCSPHEVKPCQSCRPSANDVLTGTSAAMCHSAESSASSRLTSEESVPALKGETNSESKDSSNPNELSPTPVKKPRKLPTLECIECGKLLGTRYTLRKHFETFHTGDNPRPLPKKWIKSALSKSQDSSETSDSTRNPSTQPLDNPKLGDNSEVLNKFLSDTANEEDTLSDKFLKYFSDIVTDDPPTLPPEQKPAPDHIVENVKPEVNHLHPDLYDTSGPAVLSAGFVDRALKKFETASSNVTSHPNELQSSWQVAGTAMRYLNDPNCIDDKDLFSEFQETSLDSIAGADSCFYDNQGGMLDKISYSLEKDAVNLSTAANVNVAYPVEVDQKPDILKLPVDGENTELLNPYPNIRPIDPKAEYISLALYENFLSTSNHDETSLLKDQGSTFINNASDFTSELIEKLSSENDLECSFKKSFGNIDLNQTYEDQLPESSLLETEDLFPDHVTTRIETKSSKKNAIRPVVKPATSKVKKAKCDVCNKELCSSDSKRRHMRNVHKVELPIKSKTSAPTVSPATLERLKKDVKISCSSKNNSVQNSNVLPNFTTIKTPQSVNSEINKNSNKLPNFTQAFSNSSSKDVTASTSISIMLSAKEKENASSPIIPIRETTNSQPIPAQIATNPPVRSVTAANSLAAPVTNTSVFVNTMTNTPTSIVPVTNASVPVTAAANSPSTQVNPTDESPEREMSTTPKDGFGPSLKSKKATVCCTMCDKMFCSNASQKRHLKNVHKCVADELKTQEMKKENEQECWEKVSNILKKIKEDTQNAVESKKTMKAPLPRPVSSGSKPKMPPNRGTKPTVITKVPVDDIKKQLTFTTGPGSQQILITQALPSPSSSSGQPVMQTFFIDPKIQKVELRQGNTPIAPHMVRSFIHMPGNCAPKVSLDELKTQSVARITLQKPSDGSSQTNARSVDINLQNIGLGQASSQVPVMRNRGQGEILSQNNILHSQDVKVVSGQTNINPKIVSTPTAIINSNSLLSSLLSSLPTGQVNVSGPVIGIQQIDVPRSHMPAIRINKLACNSNSTPAQANLLLPKNVSVVTGPTVIQQQPSVQTQNQVNPVPVTLHNQKNTLKQLQPPSPYNTIVSSNNNVQSIRCNDPVYQKVSLQSEKSNRTTVCTNLNAVQLPQVAKTPYPRVSTTHEVVMQSDEHQSSTASFLPSECNSLANYVNASLLSDEPELSSSYGRVFADKQNSSDPLDTSKSIPVAPSNVDQMTSIGTTVRSSLDALSDNIFPLGNALPETLHNLPPMQHQGVLPQADVATHKNSSIVLQSEVPDNHVAKFKLPGSTSLQPIIHVPTSLVRQKYASVNKLVQPTPIVARKSAPKASITLTSKPAPLTSKPAPVKVLQLNSNSGGTNSTVIQQQGGQVPCLPSINKNVTASNSSLISGPLRKPEVKLVRLDCKTMQRRSATMVLPNINSDKVISVVNCHGGKPTTRDLVKVSNLLSRIQRTSRDMEPTSVAATKGQSVEMKGIKTLSQEVKTAKETKQLKSSEDTKQTESSSMTKKTESNSMTKKTKSSKEKKQTKSSKEKKQTKSSKEIKTQYCVDPKQTALNKDDIPVVKKRPGRPPKIKRDGSCTKLVLKKISVKNSSASVPYCYRVKHKEIERRRRIQKTPSPIKRTYKTRGSRIKQEERDKNSSGSIEQEETVEKLDGRIEQEETIEKHAAKKKPVVTRTRKRKVPLEEKDKTCMDNVKDAVIDKSAKTLTVSSPQLPEKFRCKVLLKKLEVNENDLQLLKSTKPSEDIIPVEDSHKRPKRKRLCPRPYGLNRFKPPPKESKGLSPLCITLDSD